MQTEPNKNKISKGIFERIKRLIVDHRDYRIKALIGLTAVILIATSYLMLPAAGIGFKSSRQDLGEKLSDLLSHPDSFAKANNAQVLGDQTGSSDSINEQLLPDNVLPDYSVGLSCNSSEQKGKRTIKFTYSNQTPYKINLDQSTLQVDSVSINPYSVRDQQQVAALKDADIDIFSTQFDSDLMVKVTDTTPQSTQTVTATVYPPTYEYLSKQKVALLLEAERKLWVLAGNNGPIDYLEPGEHSAMIVEVPYKANVSWTAGVDYSSQQKGLSNQENYKKTVVASKDNLKTCPPIETSDNPLTSENAPVAAPIRIGSDVIECLSREATEALKTLFQLNSTTESNSQTSTQTSKFQQALATIIEKCDTAGLRDKLKLIIPLINDKTIKNWYYQYGRDATITTDEVQQIIDEVAQKYKLTIIIAPSVPVSAIQPVSKLEPKTEGLSTEAKSSFSLFDFAKSLLFGVDGHAQEVTSEPVKNTYLGPANPQNYCTANNIGTAFYSPANATWYCGGGIITYDLTKGLHTQCAADYGRVTAVSYLRNPQTGYTECYDASYIYTRDNQVLNMQYAFGEITPTLAQENLPDFNQKFLVTVSGQIIQDQFCLNESPGNPIRRGFCKQGSSYWSFNTDNTITNKSSGYCFTPSGLNVGATISTQSCAGASSQYWLVSGVGAPVDINPNPTPIPQPNSNPDNGNEYVDLPNDFKIFGSDDILNQDYIAAINTDILEAQLGVIEELKTALIDTDRQLYDEIVGKITVDCTSLDIICNSSNAVAAVNAAKVVAFYTWGKFQGIGQYFVSFVDLFKAILNHKEILPGLVNMIFQLIRDKNFVAVLLLPMLKDFNAKDLYGKAEALGKLVGQFIPDVVLAILLPGLGEFLDGASTAGRFVAIFANTLDALTNPLAVAVKGIRISAALIGLSMRFGEEVITFINKAGSAAIKGEDAIRLANKLDESDISKVVNIVEDTTEKEKIATYADDIKVCNPVAVNAPLTVQDYAQSFLFGVKTEAAGLCSGWKQIFLKKFGKDPYWSKLPLDDAVGEYKFVPRKLKGGVPDLKQRSISGGFGLIDEDGNIWLVAKGQQQGDFHFDVQTEISKGKWEHTNVNQNGTINHGDVYMKVPKANY